ncbi:MAG: redoxin domain-containing protein [Sedimentisphaerales bacterium]|nr:redoxin domain-containing protein [Sedimentisphaerales bacterium]
MNIKTLVYLCLICLFCFSCTPKEKSPTNLDIKIESKYSPEETAIVTLKLEGETLPGIPKVVAANDTTCAFFENIGSSEEVKQVPGTDNIWIAVLKSGESYVIGWIVKDNKLFGYCSDPFEAKNGLDVTFSPGMPVTLEYDISKPKEGIDVFPGVLMLSKKAMRNGKLALMDFGVVKRIEEPKVIKVEGLAKGTFQLWAQSLQAKENIDARSQFLYDKRFIEIEQGKANRLEAEFPLLDTTVEDGDVTIKGVTYNSAGEPLSNEIIKLIPINDEGPRFDLYYPEATSDSNGNFEFKGVQPDINVLIKNVGGSINLLPKYLKKDSTLWIDFIIGKLNEKIFVEYAIPDFKVHWKDGQSGSIQELWGKIAVIEAWSSSYPPSREKISKLNSLAEEYKDNEDIVFVAMSTDCNRSKWEEAVEKSGLNTLRHCIYDIDNDLAFNKPVPYAIIFDKKNIVHIEDVDMDIDIRAELEKVIEASKEE